MILDDNLILLDNASLTTTVTSNAVALNSLFKPGRAEPIPLWVKCTEAGAGGTSIAIKLTESDTEAGVYSDVPGSAETVLTAALVKDAKIYHRFLPAGVSKPWLKISVTATGTYTSGKITAAIVREDEQPYEAGMFIDKGVAEG